MIECESQFVRGLSVCQTACCVPRPIFSTVSAKRYKTDKSDFSPDELLFTSLDRISFMTYFLELNVFSLPVTQSSHARKTTRNANLLLQNKAC